MTTRLRVELGGVVQGVGFRPFARRLAQRFGVSGQVRNTGLGVELEIEGQVAALDRYLAALSADAPGGGATIRLREPLPVRGGGAFAILESEVGGLAAPSIPPDRAACEACIEEVEGQGRRARYPFTSCTACGPRWSIARASPWDRERTTMAGFPLCAACGAEQRDPQDRRAHAQTLACPACGPTLWLEQGEAAAIRGDGALARAVALLREGGVVALKGVGGWQLLCDATDEEAVARLRQRKAREARPFAVLFVTPEAVSQCAHVSSAERAALLDPAAPIVLVRARSSSPLPPSVAPGSRLVGAMLPASPLHRLIAAAVARPLICTSGNKSDEPLAIDDDDARGRLGAIADALLGHDRAIARPLDDSIVRYAGRESDTRIVVRRARGLVPRAIARRERGPVVLALGGHKKSTVALALRDAIWLSAHGGDLASPLAVERLEQSARELVAWSGQQPELVACDRHPDYASTRVAETLAGELGVPIVRVQHHAAHVAAVMAERGLTGPVLGFAWDGSGLGDDGTVWGGEALLIDGPNVTRLAQLRSFALPGGDAAARDGRRAGLGALLEAGLDPGPIAALFEGSELALLRRASERGVNSPRCSSLGRLFDAVAALTGVCTRSRFEGEAAMALEQAALDEPFGADPYELPVRRRRAGLDGALLQLDWAPMIGAIVRDVAEGAPASRIAARFHAALAHAARAVVEQARPQHVVLSGGCFLNARLFEETRSLLSRGGAAPYTVGWSGELPPGDGAIAVGQVLMAARRYESDVLGPTR